MAHDTHPVMVLVAERKLADFISPPTPGGVLEASGVIAKGAALLRHLRQRPAHRQNSSQPRARIEAAFVVRADSGTAKDTKTSPSADARAASTCSSRRRNIPTAPIRRSSTSATSPHSTSGGGGSTLRSRSATPGFEGLSAVRWRGQDYLLALCEGNRCRAGRAGRKPGGGRIHVLQRSGTLWKPVARIKLPRTVKFEDYSAVALRGRRLAVLSQQSSRLWIGTLRFGDWTIADEGKTYEFPRTKKGKIKYRTLEGLCWLTDRSFVCVSDLSKRHGKKAAPEDGPVDSRVQAFSFCPPPEVVKKLHEGLRHPPPGPG